MAKVKQNSKLNSLDLSADENNILRVDGRLNNSNLNSNCTIPTLLLKNYIATEPLLRWCHENTAYGRRNITLSEISSKCY